MDKKEQQSLMQSFCTAWKGVKIALSERNMRLQAAAGIIAVAAAFIIDISFAEKLIILLLVATVLAAELLNSALEHALNAISRNHHPDIARAKDIAAAAVLVLSVFSVIIGALIFGKHFLP